SARSASAVTSADPLHTSTPGTPSARSASTASNAARSPRSSPANSTADGRAPRSAMNERSALPLSIPGGRSSSTNRPGSSVSPVRSASAARMLRRRSNATCGSAHRRVWTATACPLSSMNVSGRAPAASSPPGSLARASATPGGGSGTVRTHDAQRSSPHCPSTPTPSTSATPPYSTATAAGRPVTITRAPTSGASRASAGAAPGCARAAAGSSTIGARVPSKSKPSTASEGDLRIASRPSAPAAVTERGEVTRPVNPLAPAVARTGRRESAAGGTRPGCGPGRPGGAVASGVRPSRPRSRDRLRPGGGGRAPGSGPDAETAGRAAALPLRPHPAQALDEHRVALQRLGAVDQDVQELVVPRRRHVEQLADGLLLGSGVRPPLPFEGEDAAVALGESVGGEGGVVRTALVGRGLGDWAIVHGRVLWGDVTTGVAGGVRRSHQVPSVVTDPGSSGFGRVSCYAPAPTSSGGSRGTGSGGSVHHIPVHLGIFSAACPPGNTGHTSPERVQTTVVRVGRSQGPGGHGETGTGKRRPLHGHGDLRREPAGRTAHRRARAGRAGACRPGARRP